MFHKRLIKKPLLLTSIIVLFFGLITTIIYSASVTDGDVTIDVIDYVPVNGWTVGEVYDAKVTVDFNDTTSIDKHIDITLPEGMRFVNYPVKGAPTAGTPGYELDSGSVLVQFITSYVDSPKQTYYPSYNGTLTYNLTTSCESIEIPFKVTVDENVYYGPKTITDAISVTANKGVTNLGDASMDVDGIGDAVFTLWSRGWVNPTLALAGSTDSVELPYIQVYRSGFLHPAAFYSKKITGYYYYPKEVKGLTTSDPSAIVEINDANGYIKSEWLNRFGSSAIVIPTISVENTVPGLYVATSKPTFQVIMYDDTVVDVMKYSPMQVNAVASIDNKLDIGITDTPYYEYSDDYYIFGPRFRMVSNQVIVKERQNVEYTIDSNYEVIYMRFPKDPVIGVVDKIQYKTNLDGTLHTAAAGQIVNSGSSVAISKDSLGLSINEYITYAIASIGNVSKGYQTSTQVNYTTGSAAIMGKLKGGIDTANVTVRTFALLSDDSVEPGSENSFTKSVYRITNPTPSLSPTSAPVTVNAGETKQVLFQLLGSHYYYTDSVGLVNPKAYIRIPENMDADLSSIVVMNNVGGHMPFTTTGPYTSTVSGEKFIEVAMTGNVGSFWDQNTYSISLYFDLIVGLGAGGNYDWSDYVFWKDDVSNNYQPAYSYEAQVVDTMDVNNNGNITEHIIPADNKDLTIISKEEMLIDTYIVPEGETRRPPYDGTSDTTIGFTPGTTAKYTLDFLNNRTDSVNSLESYFPVPKDGNNYGTNFQENEFYWNMKLGGAPTVTVYDQFGTDITASAGANYVLSYSENATTEENYQGAIYTSTSSDNTTMIKVVNTIGIPAGEKTVLEFDYVVDETLASVGLDPSRLGAINDFRPYYYFNAGTSGWQSGARVGASLEIGQIAGQAFTDTNRDGIYTDGIDTLIQNKTVDLYKKDGTYSFLATTTTDASGQYEFNELSNGVYKVNFTNIKTNQQEFTQKNQGSDEALDSDVEFAGINEGTIEDIDSTITTSRNIGAGIIDYDYVNDLHVSLNKGTTDIKLTTPEYIYTEQLVKTIFPTYFEDINATTNDITWSSSNPTTVSVSNGLIQGAQLGTATVTVTIEDMYGNTKSADCSVTITESEPSVTTSSATNIAITTATANGNITNTGGENPQRFIQWGRESGNYTNECSAGIGGTGNYSCNMTNLTGNITYYLRAKAINSIGTSYGNEITMRTIIPSDYEIFNPTKENMISYVDEGYFTLTSGTIIDTDEVTANAQIIFRTTNGQLTLPASTKITEDDSNNFDFSAFMMIDTTNNVRQENKDATSAIRFGVPGISLDFTNNATVDIFVSNVFEGEQLEVLSQEEGSAIWNHHSTCTVTNNKCTFTTNHATSYVVNGDGVIVQGEDDTQDVTVTVASVIQMDCYDKAGISGDTTVTLGTTANQGVIIAGTPAVGQSTCNISTNDENGYYLSVINDNVITSTLMHTVDSYSVPEFTPLWDETIKNTSAWNAPTTKGLGFSVIHFPEDTTHNTFDGVWTTAGNLCKEGVVSDDADYAGLPITTEAIAAVTTYNIAQTTTDICYKIDVSPSQPSGTYVGSVTYTATSDASGYYQ